MSEQLGIMPEAEVRAEGRDKRLQRAGRLALSGCMEGRRGEGREGAWPCWARVWVARRTVWCGQEGVLYREPSITTKHRTGQHQQPAALGQVAGQLARAGARRMGPGAMARRMAGRTVIGWS